MEYTKSMSSIHNLKNIKKILSKSPQETIDIARKIAGKLQPGDVIYLYGELGSGKTVFAKGLCLGIGVAEEVTSSSFVIATEYEGNIPVAHIDLYRLNQDALYTLPIDEYIRDDGITIIEWADRLNAKYKEGLEVKIKINENNSREMTIEDFRC